jgi:hypothetical protein
MDHLQKWPHLGLSHTKILAHPTPNPRVVFSPIFQICAAVCWYLLTHTEKIRKRTGTVVAFTQGVLNIVSTEKRVRLTTVLLNSEQQHDLRRLGV